MKTETTIQPIKVTTDPRVQRPLDPKRVNNILGSLDLDAIGVPVVSRRADGSVVTLDGQHRFEALRQAGFGDAAVTVIEHTGLTLEQEARLFKLLNNTKHPSVLDLFRIAVTEGDENALAINLIIERNHFTTEPSHPHSLAAIRTAETIYGLDKGTTLDRALTVANEVWGSTRFAVHTTILGGLGGVLFRYAGSIRLDRLVTKLKKDAESSDPGRFIGRIRTAAEVNGSNKTDAAAGKIITIYNKDLRQDGGERLAAWK